MNRKELGELRRRFRPDRSAISRVYGCYVNSAREIVSYLDESLGRMAQEEVEKYLGFLKKALSGQLGKNLIDIVFSTQQVADRDAHRLLSALRSTELKDGTVRQAFYDKVIASLDMGDCNYLILLAHDAYDVPYRGKDGDSQADASDQVFSYIVSCVCPVKDGKLELGFFPGENEFHSCTAGQIVAPPELGFLFPAFDDRRANLYNALFYSRKANELHQEFIDAIFHTDPPMSAAEQKEAFQDALSQSLGADCSLEVVQTVQSQLLDAMEQHKQSKDPEPLTVTAREVGRMLQECGASPEQADAFCARCGEQFGDGAALNPANLVDSKRFSVQAGEVSISVSPEYSYLVESRVINGRKYLLIPADGEVEVNGMAVALTSGTPLAGIAE